MSLPKFTTTLSFWNQDIKGREYREAEVEVLTLNLNSGSMRVRVLLDGKPAGVRDIDIDDFFKHYELTPK